jgi:hypothetical protein
MRNAGRDLRVGHSRLDVTLLEGLFVASKRTKISSKKSAAPLKKLSSKNMKSTKGGATAIEYPLPGLVPTPPKPPIPAKFR